jgi:hypothetical protein
VKARVDVHRRLPRESYERPRFRELQAAIWARYLKVLAEREESLAGIPVRGRDDG